MKKLFLALVFTSIITHGQIKTGLIEYGLVISDDKELEKGLMSEYFSDAKKNAIYVSYSLDFNSTEMIFYKNEKMNGDNNNTVFSEAFSGVNGKLYKEKSSDFILNELDDKMLGHLILKKELNPKWTLLKNTKKIQNYVCYEATTVIEIKNSVGVFKRNVVAWYCPKIPVSYGPKGYSGLPGLILELQEKNIIFGAKKITLNPANVIIVKPTKYKIVTEIEYQKMAEKSMQEMQN
jgi:GLPGLI family protein